MRRWRALVAVAVLAGATRAGPPARPEHPPGAAPRVVCRKPTAPIDLEILVLSGGQPGEDTTLLLVAQPGAPGGTLDLGLELPPGLRVVSGTSAESVTPGSEPRVLRVEVELPASGRFQLLGRARWRAPGGQVWARATTLELPLGLAEEPRVQPLVPVPGGGFRVELSGEVPE